MSTSLGSSSAPHGKPGSAVRPEETEGGRALAPITAAVGGLGRAGWNMHVHQMRQDGRFQVISAMDPEPARQLEAESQLGCETYDNFDAMLVATEAELVVVASPSNLHGKHAIAALERGKHVVVEKPMAMSVAEADRMIAAAKSARRQLLVHQNHRFGKLFAFLKETIDGGKLGQIFHIGLCSHSYRLRMDWQTLSRHGGGELSNSGSHYLDLVLRLLGAEVRDVLCDLKHVADAGDAEDHIKIFMRAANGVTADVEISTKAATTRQAPFWTILGDAGALTVDQGQAHLKYYDRSRIAPPTPQGTLAAHGRQYTPESILPWQEEDIAAEGTTHGTFYDNVFSAIRLNKPFLVDMTEVRQVIDLVARCRAESPVSRRVTGLIGIHPGR